MGEPELPGSKEYHHPSLADETPETLRRRIDYLKEKIARTLQRGREETDQESREVAKMEAVRLKRYEALLENHLEKISRGEKPPAVTPIAEEPKDEKKELDERAFWAKHRLPNVNEVVQTVVDHDNKTARYQKREKESGDEVKKLNRNRRGELTTPLDEQPLADDEAFMLKRLREGASTSDEDEKLIIQAETKQFADKKQRERNVAVYQKRALEYRGKIAAIDKQLAEYRQKAESTWYGSVLNATLNRGKINDLEKQRQILEDRAEEAEQTMLRVERNLPEFSKPRVGLGGRAESYSAFNERSKEQLRFDEKLDEFQTVRRRARDASNALLVGKNLSGRLLTAQDKTAIVKAFIHEVAALNENTTIAERKAMDKINQDIDDIYLPLVKISVSDLQALQTFGLEPEAKKELETIKNMSLRRLKATEAVASSGKTKELRQEAQESLRTLKRDLDGKTAEELNTKVLMTIEAALQLADLPLEPIAKGKLIRHYLRSLDTIQESLQLSGEAKQALMDIKERLQAKK